MSQSGPRSVSPCTFWRSALREHSPHALSLWRGHTKNSGGFSKTREWCVDCDPVTRYLTLLNEGCQNEESSCLPASQPPDAGRSGSNPEHEKMGSGCLRPLCIWCVLATPSRSANASTLRALFVERKRSARVIVEVHGNRERTAITQRPQPARPES
jgi:hypothetical protein